MLWRGVRVYSSVSPSVMPGKEMSSAVLQCRGLEHKYYFKQPFQNGSREYLLVNHISSCNSTVHFVGTQIYSLNVWLTCEETNTFIYCIKGITYWPTWIYYDSIPVRWTRNKLPYNEINGYFSSLANELWYFSGTQVSPFYSATFKPSILQRTISITF